eukprot:4983346-Prymnesium_polylepis.1
MSPPAGDRCETAETAVGYYRHAGRHGAPSGQAGTYSLASDCFCAVLGVFTYWGGPLRHASAAAVTSLPTCAQAWTLCAA